MKSLKTKYIKSLLLITSCLILISCGSKENKFQEEEQKVTTEEASQQ
jgi:ABC-type Fe3+-citrate transport system substrate-binding protein